MKHLMRSAMAFLVICPVMISSLHAQTLPNSFNYQGRLTDTAGTPMPNGNYQMVFSIWDAVTGGNQLWGSGNKTVALNKGLFTIALGPITSAVLPASKTFLQIQLGTDTPMPRIALGAVPYALKAVELLWPAVASLSNASSVLSLTNSGAGAAIIAINTGGGAAGVFQIKNAANNNSALFVSTNGGGLAIQASTDGTGTAIYSLATGSGTAGKFETVGTADLTTLVVRNKATGSAAYFDSVGGSASTLASHTTGKGPAGQFEIANTANTQPGVLATTTGSGPAIKATPGTGLAGLFEGTLQANSLKLPVGANNGYILKSDANGVGSWKPVDSTFTDLSVTGSLSALNLIIDPNNTNTGTVNSGAIRLGTASGEGIFSKRTAGGNQYGLELATSFTSRLAITGAGNVGIGTNAPAHKLHVKGSQTGGYSTPMSYIENTNSTGNSAPALRLGGSGNSVDGVLNISNFGTGKVAVFGGTGGEVANIDTSGNLSVAGNVTVGGNISIPNMPAVAFSNHRDDVSWNHGDVKYLETIPVKAPANGYFVLDGAVNVRAALTPAYDNARYQLTLYDATNSGSKIYLESTSYVLSLTATSTNIVNELSLTVNWVYPVNKGQSVTFQLEGELKAESNPLSVHTTKTSLRVLFVSNQLTQ